MKDKVALEQSRLNQRVGFEARMHRANAPSSTNALTSCAPDGAGYISNADRFHSDTSGEEYEKRLRDAERRKQIDENKRNQVYKHKRWRKKTRMRRRGEYSH